MPIVTPTGCAKLARILGVGSPYAKSPIVSSISWSALLTEAICDMVAEDAGEAEKL